MASRAIRRIKGWVSSKPEVHPVTQGVHNFYTGLVVERIKELAFLAQERQTLLRTYVEDPLKQLRTITRRGSVIIIEGLPGTGKTNLALLIVEANEDRAIYASNNPGISGIFIDNFTDLDNWLNINADELKIFIWDDVADIFTSRRSMRDEHLKVREKLLESRKKGVCLIVIQHFEKGADIDFRRFANWQLVKPWEEVPGDLTPDVPISERQKLVAYRNKTFKWWTDKLPICKTEFDSIERGKWKVVTTTVYKTPTEIPKVEDKTFEEYAVLRAKAEFGDVYGEVLELWYQGKIQDEIARQYGYGQSWASKKIKKITAEAIGYWYEDYWCEQKGISSNPDKNRSIPDAIIDEVPYSLKLLNQSRNVTSFKIEDECAPEQEAAKEYFILCAYNPLQKVYVEEKIPKSAFRITIKWNKGIVEYK